MKSSAVAHFNGQPRAEANGTTHAENLHHQAAKWATPGARDWKDSDGMSTTGTNPDGSERERLDQLPRQVFEFARRFHLDPKTPKDGAPTSKTGRVLNPLFVEALMGWPIGWSACAFSATASSRSRLPSPSDCSSSAEVG